MHRIFTMKTELCSFHLVRRWAVFQPCTTFPSSLFTNDLFLSKSAPQDIANRWGLKSLAVARTPCLSRSNAQRAAGRTRKEGGSIVLQGSKSQSLLRAGTHWAPCGVWNTASLHRVPSTRSSLLWSHSRAVMGEDWVHPMRILLQSHAEQQSPAVRKWRYITWWEWREAPEAFKKVTSR